MIKVIWNLEEQNEDLGDDENGFNCCYKNMTASS
jgi:hypothetical protein